MLGRMVPGTNGSAGGGDDQPYSSTKMPLEPGTDSSLRCEVGDPHGNWGLPHGCRIVPP